MEDRLQCVESKQVRYRTTTELIWKVIVPKEAAINSSEVSKYEAAQQQQKVKKQKLVEEEGGEGKTAGGTEGEGGEDKPSPSPTPVDVQQEEVIPIIPFDACLAKFAEPKLLEDYFSPALQRKGLATQTLRFKTFPRYLVVQVMRYTTDPMTWQPKKLEASIELPESLDLTALRYVCTYVCT